MEVLSFVFINTILLFSFSEASAIVDAITQSQSITDDKSFLVSKHGSFQLGFFSPGNSKNRYLGIWYKKIPVKTVVWVANRSKPIEDSSGVLKINKTTSNFVLLGQNKTVVWSTNSSRKAESPLLQLLDSGNLVLRDENDENPEKYLWQSFDFPCDTLLPGMKLGWNRRTGLNRRLSAWKSLDDPSPGNLTWAMELHEYPEPVMWNGTKEYFRSGPWNGIQYSGKATKALPLIKFSFFSNEDEVYLAIEPLNKSLIARMAIYETAHFHRQALLWLEPDKNWTLYAGYPRDQCESYGLCGVNGNCVVSGSPVCQCLERFRPKSPERWELNDWSLGCERNKALKYCPNDDGFGRYKGLKLPDTTHTWVDHSMNLVECRAKCLNNCSCMAYANTDVRDGGKGCVIWFGDLIDVRQIPGGGVDSQDLFIRLAASELEAKRAEWKVGVIVASAVSVIIGMLVLYYYRCTERKNSKGKDNEGQLEDLELPLFDLSTIAAATDNFSFDNKLGEGGFGPVYKGKLLDGQEIAVKRLSRSSGQGLTEFKSEVTLIAKLQHRNLVKLLGCCIHGEEKLLIYEYVQNKSLDFFLYDQERRKLLDWSKRFDIICGVARGLLYLHQDSRLRIIHRDLKASNVLLDSDMNPKISDFGLARSFGGDQTEGINTKRIVGTYGYMAPEYATGGQFSIKSDVFSFGILLLEIITGKRNKGFYHMKLNLNLIGNAWRLWREGRALDLMDECIKNNSFNASKLLRCIQISLLCVHQRPGDRPTMSSVVQMLGSESALPEPAEPGFFMANNSGEETSASPPSINEVTITELEAR